MMNQYQLAIIVPLCSYEQANGFKPMSSIIFRRSLHSLLSITMTYEDMAPS
jgi:hypothetical protein